MLQEGVIRREPKANGVDGPRDLPLRLAPRALAMLFGALLLALALALPQYARGHYVDIDFEAFYCGAAALDAGADPYAQEPLHGCENGVYWKERAGDAVIPAPLPGVVLRALAPLSRLPYSGARWLWFALQCAAIYGSIRLLVQLTRAPWIPLALAVGAGSILSLTLGQTVPFCLLGVTIAAFALRQDRPHLLACGLALLTVQPQVLLPSVAAVLLLGYARDRIAAALVFAAIVVLNIASAGVPAGIEYVTKVLPLHAYAELWNNEQYSLAALLFQDSVKPSIALLCGSFSYACTSIAGIIAAALLVRITRDRAYIALAPPAFAVFLGTYVHLQLYALALPLAFMLAVYTRSRTVGAIAVALAIPWQWIVLTFYLIPAAIVATAMLAHMWCTRSIRVAGTVAVLAGIVTLVEFFSYARALPQIVPAFYYPLHPHVLAQYAWIPFERIYGVIGAGAGLSCARVVSMIALAALLAVSFRVRRMATVAVS